MMGSPLDKTVYLAELPDRMAAIRESYSKPTNDGQIAERKGKQVEQDETSEDEGTLSEAESALDEVDESGTDDDEDDEDQSMGEPGLVLHREINAPLIWHASLDMFNPNPFKVSSSATTGVVSPLADKIDEEALLNQLLEEDDIDALDSEAAEAQEADLWKEIERGRAGGSQQVEDVVSSPDEDPEEVDAVKRETVGGFRKLRFAKPTLVRAVKSQVYVMDGK